MSEIFDDGDDVFESAGDVAIAPPLTLIVAAPPAAALALTLTVMQRAAVALGTAAHELTLRELLTNSASILTITNKAGREECHAAYMVLKNTRCDITNLAEDATEDAKKFTKAVKAEASRLHTITAAEELRLLTLRDAYDAEELARKEALIAAERARVDAIKADIEALRAIPQQMIGKKAADLSDAIKDMQGMIPTAERFDTFLPNAVTVAEGVIASLQTMLDTAIAAEAEAARLADELAANTKRLEDERAQIAADMKELAAIRAANAKAKALEAEKNKAAQAALDEQQRAQDAAAADLEQQKAAFAAEKQAHVDEQVRVASLAAAAASTAAAETRRLAQAETDRIVTAARIAEEAAADALRLVQQVAEPAAAAPVAPPVDIMAACSASIQRGMDRDADARSGRSYGLTRPAIDAALSPAGLALMPIVVAAVADDVLLEPTDLQILRLIMNVFEMTGAVALKRMRRIDLAALEKLGEELT